MMVDEESIHCLAAILNQLHLYVSAGKLFCKACREEVGLKASIVKLNIASTKHTNAKAGLKEKRKREEDIVK